MVLGGFTGIGKDPAKVGTMTWKQVSLSEFHICGIDTSDKLYCWGNNNFGQLGDGTFSFQWVPTQLIFEAN